MREILFRGKTNKGEWVYGDLLNVGVDYDYAIRTYGGREHGQVNAVNEKTIGQYTGLTDKNGKKIFEGDIIKQTFHLKQTNGSWAREIISVVEYGISYAYSNVCGVCERFSDGSGIAMLSVMDTRGIVDCEVIGNIHDNPELLKGE